MSVAIYLFIPWITRILLVKASNCIINCRSKIDDVAKGNVRAQTFRGTETAMEQRWYQNNKMSCDTGKPF